jgi:hypothetical protein
MGRKVSTALEEARDALKKDDVAAWATAKANLEAASNEMAQELYQGTTSPPPSDDHGPKKPDDDDVIDAEFTEAA